ncbi:MAG: ABC transporter permease [Candidatus Dormibacteraceae bacterium]
MAVVAFNAASPYFFTHQSLIAITSTAAPVSVVAVAVSFLLISGEFDLSVGTMYAFTPIVWIILFQQQGWDPTLALAAALLLACLFGLANGLITVLFRVPSFIVTLGAFFVLEGLNNLLIGGGDFVINGNQPIIGLLGAKLGNTPFYATVLWMLGVVFVGWFVLTRMTYGNWSIAAGSNPAIARAMGVPVGRVKIANFVVTALLAGFAGCLQSAYLRSVTQGQGQDLALLAITAIVVGGTSIYGGTGSIIGAAIGAFLVSVIEVGLILVGAPGTFYISFIGGVLVVAVILNSRLTRLQRLSRG